MLRNYTSPGKIWKGSPHPNTMEGEEAEKLDTKEVKPGAKKADAGDKVKKEKIYLKKRKVRREDQDK